MVVMSKLQHIYPEGEVHKYSTGGTRTNIFPANRSVFGLRISLVGNFHLNFVFPEKVGLQSRVKLYTVMSS